MRSYRPDGLDLIKKYLKDAENAGATITYGGGGNYNIQVISKNYKDAEKILDKSIKKALNLVTKNFGQGEFIRKEKE